MNEVVLVTGASRGIGGALARAFGRAGRRVAVHYLSRRADAESVLSDLSGMGAEAALFPADVSDPRQAADLIEAVVRKWGRIDGLVNNAGISRDRSIAHMSVEEWRNVIDVNLSGVFYCLQAASRPMRREKTGFIINIASMVGVRGAVGCANYAAAKAGVVGLTKAAARELGRYRIRVNAVLPGYHPTEMSEHLPPESLRRLVSEHVLGRTTAMEDVTRLVVALSETPTVSGQVFNVDSRIW